MMTKVGENCERKLEKKLENVGNFLEIMKHLPHDFVSKNFSVSL